MDGSRESRENQFHTWRIRFQLHLGLFSLACSWTKISLVAEITHYIERNPLRSPHIFRSINLSDRHWTSMIQHTSIKISSIFTSFSQNICDDEIRFDSCKVFWRHIHQNVISETFQIVSSEILLDAAISDFYGRLT